MAIADTIANQFRQPKGFLGRMIARMMNKGNAREYDLIIKELDIKPKERLFEIGYGPGIGIQKIMAKYDCHISGIDFSELMFQMASKRNRKNMGMDRVQLGYGDFLDYPIQEEAFHKIFCLNVVYFWNDLEIPFKKIRKGLKESGIFTFVMAHPDDLNRLPFTKGSIFNKYTIEEIVDKLKVSGFSSIEYAFDWVYLVKCKK